MDAIAVEPPPKTGMTVAELLNRSQRALTHAGVDTAALEVTWLLEKALRTTSLKLRLERHRKLTERECAEAETLISRRTAREPLQYILGTQEFCGLDFEVGPAVLIPRPETELLIEEAVQAVKGKNQPIMVDIGTGSGCLAVTLATRLPSAVVYAVDCSPTALAVASKNIARHSVEGRLSCVLGDLCSPLESLQLKGRGDVIVSNPPYIAEHEWPALQPEVRDFEPRSALVAGPIGIEMHRRLIEQAWRYLISGGWLFMEVGKGQSDAVRRLASQTGRYADATVRRDAAGIERIVGLRSLT
jgi:release factor glutamine methyltransferase